MYGSTFSYVEIIEYVTDNVSNHCNLIPTILTQYI